MKKTFYSLIGVMALLATASCSNEEQETLLEDSAVVAFSVALENQMDTRAISDGQKIDQLIYAVFNEDGSKVLSSKKVVAVSDLVNGEWIEMTLPMGHTYKVVFWAQNSSCEAYEVSDDMTVTVDYNGFNNDENRDAFFAATLPFEVKRTMAKEIVLRRPFAQVNVGTYASELEYAKELGINITKSSTRINDVANRINLVDGSVEGTVDVEFEAAALPAEKLSVDLNNDNEKELYEYVSMCYVLAGENSKHKMEFVFSDDEGKSIVVSEGLDMVPLFRNWRTNILGWIFTGHADLKIKVDTEYDDDFNVVTSNKGVYYNVSENTTFENTVYMLSNTNEGAHFASVDGQLITLNNVHFYGSVWTVVLGEYRGPKYHNYNNILNDVTCSTNHANLTVGDGTTVDYIYCTQPAKYGSRLIITEGATVGELHLVNASFESMDIRGNVGKIYYNGVEYTLDELKALGL